MREILFRYVFKNRETGELVKLFFNLNEIQPGSARLTAFLHNGFFELVARDEFTGLTDKNGKKIFEGDIVKWGHVPGGKENPIRIAEVKINPDIQFHSNVGMFPYGCFAYQETQKYLEVIGNIHDNPELLGGDTP